MATGHFALLRELARPTLVKVGGAVATGLFFYDALSNQFALPKLGALLGRSGNLLPWWGWLLILQSVLVYALFEYVRRLPLSFEAVDIASYGERIKRLEERADGAVVVPAVGLASAKPKVRGLTDADRERVAEMIRDIHDFMGGRVEPFRIKLVRAICGSNPPDLDSIGKWVDEQNAVASEANELWRRHSHFLELIGLDILPLLQGTEALRNPMRDAYEARSWPPKAQQEPANQLNTAFSTLGNDMTAIGEALKAKRDEFGV